MIKVRNLNQTCFAFPSQWEGETTEGENFYARYRWGWFYAEIDGKLIYEWESGDDFDGVMPEEEMMNHLKDIVEFI